MFCKVYKYILPKN
ncbi:uncharacterized protein CELE_R10E9.4 [Caenorhabditis elegans]|uniref:Uncharacterized protein n=1 Tax=Caenorhabditis elegans TaxID=6239 RepID=A0A2K5ATV1_CAEEL|nr:Uncharacterized protein CELE_R10E9.4 [Caenorhabditis elegans]SPC47545.2 Uncharacterized protein CELE_R10E9.4 [Caenorhabditis elegans]|eukprot:NP_001348750.2 Uncharacterized protein CELE_R10E9.4 [Caenorhabditis elegans]